MVIAPWKNEKNENDETFGYYRAWIRSTEGSFRLFPHENIHADLCDLGDMCRIIFVDYGNECQIERSKLLSCPSSVSCLPWLAIRVRFQQYLSHDEFKRFWYRTDSHWIKIKVTRIHTTHYTVQVFIDYTSVILNEDRKIKSHFKEKFDSPNHNQMNSTGNEEPKLIPDDHSAGILYEIQKKLNQLAEKIDENQKINDEHYQQLLQLNQH